MKTYYAAIALLFVLISPALTTMDSAELSAVIVVLKQRLTALQDINAGNDANETQAAAEKEAWSHSEPVTRSSVLYWPVRTVIFVVPTCTENEDIPANAFSKVLEQNEAILKKWLIGTEVTEVGVAWRIFYPKAFDTSKSIFLQFYIASKHKNRLGLEEKGHEALRNRALELHNELRLRHGPEVLALVIDERNKGVEKTAQQYATFLLNEPFSKHSEEVGKYGETLARVSGRTAVPFGETAAEFACEKRYNGIGFYNFKKFEFDYAGHFTSFTTMVWKDTKEMIIAVGYKYSVDDGFMMQIVGRYYPPINVTPPYNGEQDIYKNNVKVSNKG